MQSSIMRPSSRRLLTGRHVLDHCVYDPTRQAISAAADKGEIWLFCSFFNHQVILAILRCPEKSRDFIHLPSDLIKPNSF